MSFEGAIGEIDLVQRLVELGREHFTGAIRFEQDGVIKIVYFKDGNVLSASTNDRKDAVDEILLRAGKVGREHVKQALAKRKENETLGDALLNLGFITRKELTWARRVQVIGIIRSVRAWSTGTFAIVPDYLPKREEGTLFPLQQIIVEFIVTESDRQPFDRATDSGSAVFHKTAAFDEAFRDLDLNESAAAIAEQIDGQKNAAEIASTTGEEAFNVYKLLEALRTLGLIEKGAARQEADSFGFESAGVADAADAWSDLGPSPLQSEAEVAPMSFTPAAEPEPEPQWQMEPEPLPEPEPEPEPAPAAAPEPQPTHTIIPPIDQTIDMPLDINRPLKPKTVERPAPTMEMKFDEGRKIPFALSMDPKSTATADEPQWGFDEAQIEASRQATEIPNSVPSRESKARAAAMPARTKAQPGRQSSVAFVLIVVLLAAGIGVGGWMWWKGRQTPPPPVVTAPAKRPVIIPTATQPPVQTASTETLVPAPVTTTTQPPPPSTPQQTTPAPAPVPRPQATKPVTPKTEVTQQTTTGGRTMITNVAPAPASSDVGRAKYDAMAQQYAQNPTGNFTVQFELVCQPASLGKAIAAGGASVWFVPISYRGQSCYRVFWGHFDTRAAAVTAAQNIPAGLRGSAPVVVSVPRP